MLMGSLPEESPWLKRLLGLLLFGFILRHESDNV